MPVVFGNFKYDLKQKRFGGMMEVEARLLTNEG